VSDSLQHRIIDTDEARAALAEASRQATLPADQIDLDAMSIPQPWEVYSEEDHQVWRTVFEQRMEQLRDEGSRVFLDGMKIIGLSPDAVPELDRINGFLEPRTGWVSKAVPGYLPARSFFAFLAKRRFPTTISVRPKDRLDYLPEPDIIHDVFGHVPLHAVPAFADFLQTYGRTALLADDPKDVEALARLFWFTVEFGLIFEDGRTRLYGAGLISSPGEGRYALASPEVDRRPFDLERVCATPFEIDHYQPILYVLDSFEQLRDAMNNYAARLEAKGKLRDRPAAAVEAQTAPAPPPPAE
jgi:phenylalanine-4-hydroxylase